MLFIKPTNIYIAQYKVYEAAHIKFSSSFLLEIFFLLLILSGAKSVQVVGRLMSQQYSKVHAKIIIKSHLLFLFVPKLCNIT